MGCSNDKNAQSPRKLKQLSVGKNEKDELAMSNESINLYYRFEKLLGSGNFGTVKLACLRTDRYKQYAIKSIPKDKLHLLFRELSLLRQLDHPNVARFYESYQDDRYIYFVMEYCSGGELFEQIISKGSFTEKEAATTMERLFSAVSYLHLKNVVHRDLKPENLLLSHRGNDKQIKIIDFGLSKKFKSSTKELNTKVGTPLYVAPEILNGKYEEFNKNQILRYGVECDDWSLGIIMYVLLCGSPPFVGNSPQEVFDLIKTGKPKFSESSWQNVSEEAKDLIKKLLQVDVSKRIRSNEAIKHKWFEIVDKLNPQQNKDQQVEDHEKTIRLLQNYSISKRFKKEALKVIANQMKDKEIRILHEKFQQFDIERNGIITLGEMKQIMNQCGYTATEQEIADFIQKFNPQETTNLYELHINYSEFIAAILDKRIYLNNERLWTLFQYFDTDKSGEITIENMREVMARTGRKLPENELQEIIEEVGDQGKINFDKFCKMMQDEDNEEIIQELDQKFEEKQQKKNKEA